MSTQSNAVPEFPQQARAVSPPAWAPTRPMYWSIRRELWENRSVYLAPLIVAGVILVGFLVATIGRALSTSNLAQRREILEEPYGFATAILMLAAAVVGLLYCLDALHGERRDRSILFWKSLPVSDLTTVLAKASIAFLVVPLFAFVITVVMQWIMLLLSSVVLLESGLSAATLWAQTSTSQIQLLYHLLTVHVLWYAPLYAWLLLVSAWARRATFLWAGLPPLAIYIVERLIFRTSHFAALLRYRLTGPEWFVVQAPGSLKGHAMLHLDPAKFLSTPGLWTGLAVAAIFLAAAVRLRRHQGPI